jgi:type VI secretion system protein ImpA
MIQNFWDTLYPEVEDGDLELRAAPLSWAGASLVDQVKKIPLTRSRYDWFKYLESRAVGYEEACLGNETRVKARETAIAEKKLSPEAFDRDAELTPRDFHVDLANELELSLRALRALGDLCNEKLKGDSPSFAPLRTALEDLQSFVARFVQEEKEEEPASEPPQRAADPIPAAAGAERLPAKKQVVLQDPVDREEAIRRIEVAANCLRRMDPSSPASYLVLRGLRWAELFARQSSGTAADLDAPSSETRQQLRRLAKGGEWRELLEASEASLASPCGSGWLDLQRYSAQACRELGRDYDPVFAAIRSGLGALMMEFPDLPKAQFLDETSVANPETLTWLEENFTSSRPDGAGVAGTPQQVSSSSDAADRPPDARELAMRAVRSGRVQEAMEILTREIAQERSGRKRFERKTQLAQVCLAAGQESIAYPILKDLAQEIECRKLEDWESAAVLANPLTLLFRCMEKMGGDAREKQEIYERICRLDPIQALACLK